MDWVEMGGFLRLQEGLIVPKERSPKPRINTGLPTYCSFPLYRLFAPHPHACIPSILHLLTLQTIYIDLCTWLYPDLLHFISNSPLVLPVTWEDLADCRTLRRVRSFATCKIIAALAVVP